MTGSIQDQLAGWLAAAGLIVSSMTSGLPSNASWGLTVSTPPPVRVTMRVMGLRGGQIVLGIGINLSPMHREKIMSLPPAERVAFTASLVSKLIDTCPYCRFGIQGGMNEPQAFVAEILYFNDTVEKQRLIDDISRLVNIYLLINSELWRRFPEETSEQARGRLTFM